MCYWKKESDDKLNIAKTDITVYKVTCSDSITKNGFTSRYQGFKYKFGKTYNIDKDLFNRTPTNIGLNEGFHSYSKIHYSDDTKYFVKVKAAKYTSITISENNYCEGVIIECVIPKGSQYFFNGIDYISDSLTPICLILPFDDKMFKLYRSMFKKLIKDYYKITLHE